MVSAWALRNPLVLGQEASEEKPNAITAIPKLRLSQERCATTWEDDHRANVGLGQ